MTRRLAFLMALATGLPAEPHVSATLGERKTLLDDGRFGLRYFPDGGVTLLQKSPKYRVLMAAGVSSFLLEGASMGSLELVRKVLQPGPKGSFDNGYAGIFGAHAGLAVYHAEDQEGMRLLPGGVRGFYASVGAAVSQDGGFRKLGPIVTSQLPKDPAGRGDQGCGEPSIVAETSGRYLYCYYTDHSRVENRGVQICLARAEVSGDGMPGTWRKYFGSSFSEPGLGGKDTPVLSANQDEADAIFPNVTYSETLGKYVMVLNINYYRELAGPAAAKSGMYIAFSADGIRWSKLEQISKNFSIARIDKEVAWHPALVLAPGSLEGWLYYAYSPRWGHGEGRKPHYLVGQPIRLVAQAIEPVLSSECCNEEA